MIDQERFDGLARGLATNRLSRGQVLKSVAVGLLLSSIGVLSPRHTRVAAAKKKPAKKKPTVPPPKWCEKVPNPAPPTPVKPDYPPVKANVVKGGCEDFRRKRLKAPGKKPPPDPDAAGATDCLSTIKKVPLYDYKEVTKPGGGGSLVCLEITYVYPATFTGQAEIYQLDWKPSSSGCKAYESEIEKTITDHEKVHANDCHAIAKKGSSVWNSHKKQSLKGFQACGTGPGGTEEARKKIEDEIKASLDEFWNTEMVPCINDKGDKFDKAKGPLPICCGGEGPDKCGCPKGKKCCGDKASGPVCVDLKTDRKNCGRCGNVCRKNEMCKAGKCVCTPGSARSGASGSALGAGLAAGATLCCPEGQTECGGACVDSCVSPEVRDPNTCTCGCPPGGDPNCCPPGKTFCPNAGNGVCVDLSQGIFNPDGYGTDYCGACDDRCRPGSGASCVQGKCQCGPQTTCNLEGVCPGGKTNCQPNEKVSCCDPPGPGKYSKCCHDPKGYPYCCPSDNACSTSDVQGCIPP